MSPYAGRVEYLAHKQTVEEMRSQGHSIKHIHTTLYNDGLITISYRNFCRYVADSEPSSPSDEPSASKVPIPQKTSDLVPISKKFKHKNQIVADSTMAQLGNDQKEK